MSMRLSFASLTVAAILMVVGPSQAAVFLLVSGGQIEGEWLNRNEKQRQTYVVRMDSGGVITLGNAQVDEVLEKSEDLAWYEQELPKIQQTIEGHWGMAEKCRERRLKEQREHHLEEILKLDPEHERARHGLGYSRVDDRWVKTDEWKTNQGYIRYRGDWRIPQDVMLEKAAEEADKRERDWKKQVTTWRTWITRPRGKEQDAIDAIRAIDDPNAAAALAVILKDEKEQRNLRMLVIEAMGGLESPVAVGAFIERAMKDPDPNVRDACLDQLVHFGTARAVQAFQKLLEASDNKIVNRAAFCLGSLGQPEATLALINSLVTEHRFLVQTSGAPGRMNVGFGDGPGGGGNNFGVGGRPKLVKPKLQNESVLNALVALNPGVHFGYNIEAWKAWYVDQHQPLPGDLRRDD